MTLAFYLLSFPSASVSAYSRGRVTLVVFSAISLTDNRVSKFITEACVHLKMCVCVCVCVCVLVYNSGFYLKVKCIIIYIKTLGLILSKLKCCKH